MIFSYLRRIGGYFIALALMISGNVGNVINRGLNGQLILSIYFHKPSKRTFRSIIKWLEKKGFHFINANELIDIIEKKVVFPKGAVFVSIDDGWKHNIENVFETEEGKTIPITLFATMGPIIEKNGFWWSYIEKGTSMGLKIGRKKRMKEISNEEKNKLVNILKSIINIDQEAISLEELKTLAKKNNITIGCHTYSHPILTKCNEETLEYEISRSKEIIENYLAKSINYFAYPNGIHSKRESNVVEKSGYNAAFGTNPAYIENNKEIDIYDIPRFEIEDSASFMENICRLTGIWYKINLSQKDNA